MSKRRKPYFKRDKGMSKLRCSICRKEKFIEEFRKAKARIISGRSSWCKPCTREYNLNWRNKNLAKAREAGRNSDKKHREKLKAEGRPYRPKPVVRPLYKREANRLVHNAIRRGEIIRPKLCQSCHRPKKRINAHHPDYRKPMEVIFLCSSCHGLQHRFPLLEIKE